MNSLPNALPLGEIVLGITELAPFSVVARRLAEAAREVTHAEYAALGEYGADARIRRFEAAGMTEQERAELTDPPFGSGVLGEFARGAKTINVSAVADDPRAIGFPVGHPEMGPFLGLAVTYGSQAIGAFYVTRPPGASPFSAEEQQQLEALAPYAAIVLANTRTLENEERRGDSAEVIAETARHLQGLPSESQACELLADAMEALFTDASALALAWSVTGAEAGFPPRWAGNALSCALERPLDPRWESGQRDVTTLLPGHNVAVNAASLEGQGRLVIAVAHRAPVMLDDLERSALSAITELGAIGINASRRRQAEAALERYVVRDEIARDLHDDLIQSIYAIGLSLHGVEAAEPRTRVAISKARADLNAVIRDLRSYITHLSQGPEELKMAGLATRIKALLTHDDTPVHWTIDIELGELPIGRQVERQLYLVVREAISNIDRHSNASEASISLRRRDNTLHLEITDDGVGFDRSRVPEGSVGLRSMEERVADLGGSAVLASTPGEGTGLVATVPVAGALQGSEASNGQ